MRSHYLEHMIDVRDLPEALQAKKPKSILLSRVRCRRRFRLSHLEEIANLAGGQVAGLTSGLMFTPAWLLPRRQAIAALRRDRSTLS